MCIDKKCTQTPTNAHVRQLYLYWCIDGWICFTCVLFYVCYLCNTCIIAKNVHKRQQAHMFTYQIWTNSLTLGLYQAASTEMDSQIMSYWPPTSFYSILNYCNYKYWSFGHILVKFINKYLINIHSKFHKNLK